MSVLGDLVGRLPAGRVAIAGDVMLDHFLVGRVDRISPEAPVPVVRFARDEYRLGGAANVAHNVTALGARASLVGLIGEDEGAGELRRALAAHHIDATGLIADGSRPTTRKVRVVTLRNQQVARVDYEDDREPDVGVRLRLGQAIAEAAREAGVVVLSDYRKGVVCPDVLTAAAGAAQRAGVALLVDPKVPVAARYRGATLITPNHHEAELMTAETIRTVDDMRRAARRMHDESGASVLVTWGEHGMWLLDATGGTPRETSLPAVAREVADVTGAGDTVIALVGAALACGAGLADAAELANLGAGIVVGKFGPAAVSSEELAAAATADRSGS